MDLYAPMSARLASNRGQVLVAKAEVGQTAAWPEFVEESADASGGDGWGIDGNRVRVR